MKKLFRLKYPKLLLFLILILTSYFIFSNSYIAGLINGSFTHYHILISTFIAGILFSFGFTAPIAAGFFIVLNPINPFLSAVVGGFGVLVGNLVIFKLIRVSFTDEFSRLEKTKQFRELTKIFDKEIPKKIRMYFLFGLAGFVIASPLPDEIGEIMLSGLTRIKAFYVGIISFVLGTIGIFVLVSI